MIELLKILACLLAGISFGRWLIYSEKKAYEKGYKAGMEHDRRWHLFSKLLNNKNHS